MDLLIRGSAPTDPVALRQWVGSAEVDLLVAGSIGYTVQALAALGCSVRPVSTVGADAFGAQILRELAEQGVDVSCVQEVPGHTSLAIYPLLFGSTKRPLTFRLLDADPWPTSWPDRPDGRRPDLLLAGGLLHFSRMYHRGLPEAFTAARAAGTTTALDPQFPLEPTPAPWLPHIVDVLQHTDILLCDEHEAAHLFGTSEPAAAARAALAHGCRAAVVKCGDRGAILADATGLVEQPAVPLGTQVDGSVGAGDAFDAGFLDAYLRGRDLADAAAWATATAACSLTRPGGVRALGRQAVADLLPQVPAAHRPLAVGGP